MPDIKNHPALYIKGLVLKKPAMLVDLDEYEGMKETLEILLEQPDILKKLKISEQKLKSHKTMSWEKLKRKLKLSA